MEASVVAVDMIMKFEGRRLAAYKDPAGVPTIGYGTTVYPTGGRVRLGDTISAGEAREFIAFDVARFADAVSKAVKGVPLNQNQFDALVSFTYNIGLGAFQDSTMLKKLVAKDATGAAKEFPRWNKATVKGVKQVLPGLVKRRAAERALFARRPSGPPGPAAAATRIGPSDEPDPVTATVFNDAGATVVVLTDPASSVTDILTLPDRSPASMAVLLRQYPTLRTFAVAPAGAAIPPGERRTFAAGPRKVPPVAKAPALTRAVLARGSADGPKFPGNDVHELQARLKEIGYYTGPITGVFDSSTDDAAKAFQADYFSPAEANGRVGPKTWAKLFPVRKPPAAGAGPVKKAPVKAAPGAPATPKKPGGAAKAGTPRSYLRLVKTSEEDNGLRLLKLQFVKNGKTVGSIDVCSGTSRHQKFRKGRDSRVGSLEPLPEGRWRVHDLLWRDGRDNYNGKVWNAGLGPVKIPLDYKGPNSTARSAIQIHIDWNRRVARGTAGCVGVCNIADFKTLVGWLRDTDPRDLFVDWGLGTCPKP
ncbi:MAG: glycoside hydrolase family protein [Actinobacteria bacterium]|nr:glycoside hydrolase family protein [Actinomycetota bacterium]